MGPLVGLWDCGICGIAGFVGLWDCGIMGLWDCGIVGLWDCGIVGLGDWGMFDRCNWWVILTRPMRLAGPTSCLASPIINAVYLHGGLEGAPSH
jgi:hypothetical protein